MSDEKKIITCHFEEVDLWLRFKFACSVWWDIFVNKSLDCVDDEE